MGETDDSAYIAMEYLEGESLDTLLDNHIRLSLDRIAHIALQIANGLAYAHQHGVIHRDVKPANIILMRRGGWSRLPISALPRSRPDTPDQGRRTAWLAALYVA